jgi:hypothetical protein
VRHLLAALAALVAATTAGGALAAETPPRYNAVDLGPQEHADWVDLNDRGELTGEVGFPFGQAAVRLANGSLVTFPPFAPFERSSAVATNDAGTTVGFAALQFTFGAAGAVWGRDGATTVLGDRVFPGDVNDAGQVVGSEFVVDRNLAFLWEGGSSRRLNLFAALGINPLFVSANAVNEHGVAVGVGQDAFGVWPLLWPAGATEAVRLGRHQSSFSNTAADVNDDGVVVGTLQFATSPSRSVPVATKWVGGVLEHLPTLSGVDGRFGRAVAINDRDEIVGTAEELVVTDLGQVAALWTDEGVSDLNTLVDLPGALALVEAIDINDRGQILALAHDPTTYPTRDCCGERLFLLTPAECEPIPEDELASGDAGEGLADADGDGIPDCWEEEGIPVEAEDGALVSYRLPGADPDRKDLYVELDHMAGFAPEPGALEDVVGAFAAAPVGNPDGSTGIALHVEVDDEMPHVPGLGFDQANHVPGDFWGLKSGGPAPCDGFFGSGLERADEHCAAKLGARRLVYRYGIFGDTYGSDDSDASGVAECGTALSAGCLGRPGNDFLVTVGHHWDEAELAEVGGRRSMEAGAFMHELGHTLGLDHGGGDVVNCKPNYVSAMNYSYVLVPTETSAVRLLDYSRQAFSLDEAQLDEATGVGGAATPVVFGWMGLWSAAPGGGAIDWNRDGVIGTASANIGWLQLLGSCSAPSGLPPSKVDGNALALRTLNFRTAEYVGSSVPPPSAFEAIVCRPAPGNSFDCESVVPIRVEIRHGVVFLTLPLTVAAADWVRARYHLDEERPLQLRFEDDGSVEREDDNTEWNLQNITGRREVLSGFHDWANLRYAVRDAEGFADLAGSTRHEQEITYGEVRAVAADLLAQLDAEPPSATAGADPAPNAAGWNRGPVTVTLRAADAGSGVAEIVYDLGGGAVVFGGDETSVVVGSEGVTTLTYFARDRAGNVGEARTLVVRVDTTPPSVVVEFDPAAGDLAVRGLDSLAGPDSATHAPIAVVATGVKEERRSFAVADLAGNSVPLELVVAGAETGKLRASVAGAVTNRFEVDWKRDAGGAVERLRQLLEVGRGAAHRKLVADYDRLRDVTVITIEAAGVDKRRLERPGVHLLRLLAGGAGELTASD